MQLPSYITRADIEHSVALALREDWGSGDVTADLIPATSMARATVITREMAILCGTPWFDAVLRQVDPTLTVVWHYQEGDRVPANAVLCVIEGRARTMLTAERPALNFLQTLSGTATQTHQFVQLIAHTQCRVLDTRKTIPGLRNAQKYAVLCGGGSNHRLGLYDRVLIKENHIIATGSISAAISKARQLHPSILVEVETENLQELQEAITANADIIMLDDYSLVDMQHAVKLTAGRIPLEASGGVSRETIVAIAETGVDFVSIGGITKHIRAIDLSMRLEG